MRRGHRSRKESRESKGVERVKGVDPVEEGAMG
jgi:hypothetical protein